MTEIVRQNQLALPLLDVLADNPQGLTASEAVTAVANRLGVSEETRSARAPLPGGGSVDLFARNVRWVRQKAKEIGTIDGTVRNLWRITPKGEKDLRNATPGIVLTIFETALGRAIWAEAESAFGTIDDRSVNLWMTSFPYDLALQKDYQRGDHLAGADYIEWATALTAEMQRTLTDDGSIVLNLGDAFLPGRPVMSLYQERLILRLCDDLGLRLAEKLYWYNPAKLPSPAQWVTVKRCRVTPAVESLFWLSKSDNPKANNRNVLRPYSESMKRRIAAGGELANAQRPSGHSLAEGAFGADNGGSISPNLIIAGNTNSNDAYIRYCRENDLPIHPARFPTEVAEFPIRMLTERGDTVGDCCAGSCKVGEVAERLERRWINFERSLTYLRGAAGRFPQATLHAA